jgi:hypothetical protein
MMKTPTTLFFTTCSIYIQDGSVDEYYIGEQTTVVLQANPQTDWRESDSLEYKIKHIENAIYSIRGKVYRTYAHYAFMDLGSFNVVICNKGDTLIEGKYYECQVDMTYDIWDCYHIEMAGGFHKPIEIEGIVKQIFIDTSEYIVSESPRGMTRIGVPQRFDIAIEQTSCWEDEKYSNGSADYLVEIELCSVEK